MVRVSLKCIVDSLHSCGNRVERITAWLSVNSLLSDDSSGIYKTMFTKVPFNGSPSSTADRTESL